MYDARMVHGEIVVEMGISIEKQIEFIKGKLKEKEND